jgi:hypothetical protein
MILIGSAGRQNKQSKALKTSTLSTQVTYSIIQWTAASYLRNTINIPSTNHDGSQTPGDVEYFNYFGSLIRNDTTCTREIKSRNSIEKAAFRKNKNPFTSKLKLNARIKSVNCYIWSIAFYGNGNWTLREVDQQYMENSEMWC